MREQSLLLIKIQDTGTGIDIASGKLSAIHLTLVSDNLANESNWTVLTQNNIESDHFPILCEIGINIQKQEAERTERWSFKKANWDRYVENCDVYLTILLKW